MKTVLEQMPLVALTGSLPIKQTDILPDMFTCELPFRRLFRA